MKPDPGKPDVRNFSEGAGNVTCGARASALPDHEVFHWLRRKEDLKVAAIADAAKDNWTSVLHCSPC